MGEATKLLFECVFPDGFPYELLHPLMLVMYECGMSMRAVASTIGEITQKEYVMYLNDMYFAASPGFEPDKQVIEEIERKLRQCGFYEWLEMPGDE